MSVIFTGCVCIGLSSASSILMVFAILSIRVTSLDDVDAVY